MSYHDPESVVSKSIVVEQPVERAFYFWTERIGAWWPAGHSLSGDPKTQVFIEGRAGGRFFERASDGAEYEWGVVDVWEPPHRLAFRWYLGSSPALPTRVEVQFIALDENRTRVEVEHRGPELIGALWEQRKQAFDGGWESVLSGFVAFLSERGVSYT